VTHCYITRIPGGSQPAQGHYRAKLVYNRRIPETVTGFSFYRPNLWLVTSRAGLNWGSGYNIITKPNNRAPREWPPYRQLVAAGPTVASSNCVVGHS
jgi:hypothetical protein